MLLLLNPGRRRDPPPTGKTTRRAGHASASRVTLRTGRRFPARSQRARAPPPAATPA